MANSATGTSTSYTLGGVYQVFLSFRGPDTGRGFTNVLRRDLRDAGIRPFFADEELRLGERISGNLWQAIDVCWLYILILSPNYASSHWCLRELARMVKNTSESRREDGNEKVILPIFYDVKTDDVNLQTKLYKNAISKLEQKEEDQKKWWWFCGPRKKKFSTEEVETWRGDLKEVSGISGLHSQDYTGDGDLSRKVVKEVVDRLRTRQRRVTEDLVGIEEQIARKY